MIIQHVIGADRGFNYGCHCSWWPTTRTVPVPKYILNHRGFISVIRADSTGYYEQNKESVYMTMLAMCGTQAMLQTFLDGISNDDVQTVGNVSYVKFFSATSRAEFFASPRPSSRDACMLD